MEFHRLEEEPEKKPEGQRPLSMREAMSCVDDKGRFRCPSCGRFTTPDQITRNNLARIPSGTVSLTPRCGKCEPAP